jgi:hypothetical protein
MHTFFCLSITSHTRCKGEVTYSCPKIYWIIPTAFAVLLWLDRLSGICLQILRLRRSIFLGSDDFQASRCSLRILGNRLVQSIGAGCSDYGNQARYCITGCMTLELIRVPSPTQLRLRQFYLHCSYHWYCTNYKPNSHKTIGIYAAVLIAQDATQSSSI